MMRDGLKVEKVSLGSVGTTITGLGDGKMTGLDTGLETNSARKSFMKLNDDAKSMRDIAHFTYPFWLFENRTWGKSSY